MKISFTKTVSRADSTNKPIMEGHLVGDSETYAIMEALYRNLAIKEEMELLKAIHLAQTKEIRHKKESFNIKGKTFEDYFSLTLNYTLTTFANHKEQLLYKESLMKILEGLAEQKESFRFVRIVSTIESHDLKKNVELVLQ